MKGNDGRAARRKLIRRAWMVGSSLVGIIVVLWVGKAILGTQNHHFYYPYDGVASSGRLLRDPRRAAAAVMNRAGESAHQFRYSLHRQFSGSNKMDEAQVLHDVLAAKLQLIDLTVVEEELLRSPANSYAGVYGKFCKVDWTIRKKDPSAGTLCMCMVGSRLLLLLWIVDFGLVVSVLVPSPYPCQTIPMHSPNAPPIPVTSDKYFSIFWNEIGSLRIFTKL